jgi:hypothetical protein
MISRRLAGLSLGVCAALALASLVFLVLGPGRSVPADVFGGVGGLSFLILSLAFGTVGAIVASRVPENRIGWVFCVTGVLIGATVLAWAYADYGLHATSERLPGAAAAASFPGEPLAGLFGFALLLFPDGRLPSRRWRPVAGVLAAAVVLLFFTDLLRPGRLDDPFTMVSNGLGVPGTRAAMNAVNNIGWLLIVVGLALSAASMVVRLRRAGGIERQQLKLVLAVGALVATVVVLDMCSWLVWPHGGLQLRMGLMGLAFAMFPIAAGVAILRYRLYDIDVAINRTLVYGALTATLAGVYLGSVLLLQLALSGLTHGSTLAVAASTLAVALLFRPARSRIQDAVDRRFYRRKYDVQRTLASFAARLRDEVELDRLSAELRDVVADTMQPAHVSLWLREAGR